MIFRFQDNFPGFFNGFLHGHPPFLADFYGPAVEPFLGGHSTHPSEVTEVTAAELSRDGEAASEELASERFVGAAVPRGVRFGPMGWVKGWGFSPGILIWVVATQRFFIFTPKIGEDSHFDEHIFQRG